MVGGGVRGEVDQAVVAGTAGHAMGGGVLAALALGDQDLDRRAGQLPVQCTISSVLSARA